MSSVHEAWTAAMAEVQAIRKTERNSAQGFNFRGIDNVLNAFGPAARKHQVTVVPSLREVTQEVTSTSKGKPATATRLTVEYTVYGPEGDSFVGVVPGEAMDWGDKGVAKAMSVAFRIFLLQALAIPTDEPDPDSESFERDHPPAVANALEEARKANRALVQTYSQSYGVPAKEIADAYQAAGGTADPAALKAWLKNTYGPEGGADDVSSYK